MVIAHGDEALTRRAATAAFATIAGLDARLSDYRPDSDLRAIERAAPDWLAVHTEVFAVLWRAREVAQLSGGAFDPTVAPLVALWRAARTSGAMPSEAALAAARMLVGWSRLELDPRASSVRLPVSGTRLDLGGIAKGFILQRAMDTLRDQGAPRALIEAGGDVVAGEPPPGAGGWSVRVGCGPGGGAPGAGALQLGHEALATSGPSAQFVDIDGVRYSHVVDPRTGIGVTGRHTVHVRARDAATADAWATALGVLGPAGAADATLPEGVEYCFADGT